MYTIKLFSFLIFVITLITPPPLDCMTSTKEDLYLQPDVENALLEANWQKVYDYLENDSSLAENPVARLLMGHACLATNRNNASMLLFLSLKEESDLKQWSEWTESLATRNPQNPVAIYLYADAMARSGKLAEAIEKFTQALELKNDFALALNARGVASAMTNKLDNAQVDFYLATKLAPDFADAYANLGTLGVFRETSMALDSGTVEAFNKALDINQEFALAYNGRGCIYFGSGRFEEAAQDFSIASELSPILLISEVNQGFASAYASRLLTLASIEKKPGTTLESVNRLYPNVMKEQQQQLSSVLPNQQDQTFWKKIDALPHFSDDQLQSFVSEYGIQKVSMAVFMKKQELRTQAIALNQQTQNMNDKVGLYNKVIIGSAWVGAIASLGFSSYRLSKQAAKNEGWKPLAGKGALQVAKAGAGSAVSDYNVKILVGGVPGIIENLLKRSTPVGAISSIVSSGTKVTGAVATDLRYSVETGITVLNFQSADLCTKSRAFDGAQNRLAAMASNMSVKQTPSQMPGYYTSSNGNLTDLREVAAKVSDVITTQHDPIGSSARRALVVSTNQFRANLQQDELNRHGFVTKIVTPTLDIQSEAKRFGANAIVGIKETPEIRAPEMKRITPGIETYQARQYQKQDWDWGKSFTPTYPKTTPGGISTEELARSFVDKGNWPVMTSFGLFYQAISPMESQKAEEGK